MRFPVSERIVFEHNPLVEVLFEARFPTILTIATEPPAVFQEAVRGTHPGYRRQHSVELPPGLAAAFEGISLPTPPEATTHWFETADGSRSISLGAGFVAVTERDYVDWESFKRNVDLALDALCEIYQPSFFSRVGLKYVDQIDRRALGLGGAAWSDLFVDAVSGIASADAEIVSGLVQAQTIARFGLDSVDNSAVLLQTAITGDDTFVIDADFFSETRKDRDGVAEALAVFNVEAGRLFRWAIREPLRAALGRRDA